MRRTALATLELVGRLKSGVQSRWNWRFGGRFQSSRRSGRQSRCARRTLYDARRIVIECRRMDISFSCPHCDQHVAVDKSGAGMTVNCPSCNQQIEIPRSPAPKTDTRPSWSDLKKAKIGPCPDCGKQVSSSAAACPHCGASVNRAASFSPLRVVLIVIGVIGLFLSLSGGSIVGAIASGVFILLAAIAK